ncbi:MULTISPECIES: substrate-binding periplasmic protein [Kordiimonas]|jgi:polar amino acid transport system substrate-binding protein|uniref:substrate-binding periplasmic protein n=1 Tax=Kordiimonas TaxID=288021 RepID=UPI00257ACC0A|nr:ABC transporter substrate-binding protein [Kordiimonas sp. UBA4487]
MRLVWLTLLFLLATVPAGAQTFKLVTEEQPPMNFTDPETGRVVGITTELVEAIMAKAGYEYDLSVLPWNRAYRYALRDANTCIFTTVRTPGREDKFKWVGPLYTSGWAFYRRAGADVAIDSVADIGGRAVTATTGTINISGIADIPGIQLIEVPTDQRALVLLNEGRADLWVSGVFTAFIGGDQAGVVPELAFLWRPIELSLACNIATDDEAIARLNAANETLEPLRQKLKARHYYYTRERTPAAPSE